MRNITAYYESLKHETKWIRLFIPIFISFSALLLIEVPLVHYIIDVLIKHREFDPPGIIDGICVAFLFSAIVAKIKSHENKKKNKK